MSVSMPQDLTSSDFPIVTFDKVRYADTDRQGHVNNALFATFLETGRVELLYNSEKPLMSVSGEFVIASLNLSFLGEIQWPGEVKIGTYISRVGNSSIHIRQALFQKSHCVAKAETVVVHDPQSSTALRGYPNPVGTVHSAITSNGRSHTKTPPNRHEDSLGAVLTQQTSGQYSYIRGKYPVCHRDSGAPGRRIDQL